ncbi:YveK family protein [Bacillus massilinigeriensis]|uniref:YveK family protein n=1 Tax=Bacillus mediterraneensis TaxID=1805474 RepID=UPI0008F83A7F|nr:Wzz/FepE/Etk N-terminal domain-containing protein [Bacillus mediterraneensis]
MEETISLKDLLATLKKRLALIIAITLTAVTASAVVSFFVLNPVYQSSADIIVNQKDGNQEAMYNSNVIQTNIQLINTYSGIIKNTAVLKPVIEQMNLDMSVSELKGKVSVESQNETQILTISVKDEDPKKAMEIANTIASVSEKKIADLMKLNNVQVMNKASLEESKTPIAPKPYMNIAIALVVGLMAGVGLAFLLEYFDTTIKNEQDIENLIGLPILGSISVMEGSKMDMKVKRGRGEQLGA